MLRLLNLKNVYDSSESDLINELIIPLLKESILYRRGVGFFSSSWLRLASIGLTGLIENGGSAQIILSPNISKRIGMRLERAKKLRKIQCFLIA